MNHSFDVEHAKTYGVPCAIFINHLIFWIVKNKANGKHLHTIEIEGQEVERTFTYSSLNAFTEIFPYFSVKQVRTAISKLEEAGVILSANFNQKKYDNTKWYCFKDEELFMESLPQRASPPAPEGKPIPDIKPDTKTKTKDENLFIEFWDLYDWKTGKAPTEKKWNSLSREDRQLAVKMVPVYFNYLKNKNGDLKYRKKPFKYLNERIFEDEVLNLPVQASQFKDYGG